jgi:hypothetical protein
MPRLSGWAMLSVGPFRRSERRVRRAALQVPRCKWGKGEAAAVADSEPWLDAALLCVAWVSGGGMACFEACDSAASGILNSDLFLFFSSRLFLPHLSSFLGVT